MNRQYPTYSEFGRFWTLDPTVVFLNHGSFGACPMPVLAVQQQWREQMERQPLQFFGEELEGLLDQAKSKLAAFVNCPTVDLAFVSNATSGVNAVLRSLRFKPGDELLTTTHEYNACRNALNYVAEREGVTVVVVDLPFPVTSSQQIVAAVLHQVTANTRLALLDHVTSQTGLVFPIAELVQHLTQAGVETLIDGAHAPGMLPLDLLNLGATYYTGNCHKWLSAPKGSAFLYVQPDRQSCIRPLTISHGANSPRCDRSRFQSEFDWMGTSDPTAHLAVPTAIDFLGSLLPGGWTELRQRNRALAIAARTVLCQALNIAPPCPETMIGSLAVVPLPAGNAQTLHDALLAQYGIEVPIVPWQDSSRLIRISAQIYNHLDQYNYLAVALNELLEVN